MGRYYYIALDLHKKVIAFRGLDDRLEAAMLHLLCRKMNNMTVYQQKTLFQHPANESIEE